MASESAVRKALEYDLEWRWETWNPREFLDIRESQVWGGGNTVSEAAAAWMASNIAFVLCGRPGKKPPAVTRIWRWFPGQERSVWVEFTDRSRGRVERLDVTIWSEADNTLALEITRGEGSKNRVLRTCLGDIVWEAGKPSIENTRPYPKLSYVSDLPPSPFEAHD